MADRAVLRPLAKLISAVAEAAGGTPILLLGAAARDIHLVHVHGVPVERATEDTDLAFAVPSWDVFLRMRGTLLSSGFTSDRPLHRLWFGDQQLDIVPFGELEASDRSITWPTKDGEVMVVAGLREALATAVDLRLPGGVSVEMASLPALACLKIWAWENRRHTARKDAPDLWMFLKHYASAGNEDRVYGDECEAAFSAFGFDLEITGAWLLGKDGAGRPGTRS